MADITVVGLGPGSREYLTRAAEEAVSQADVLVGGRRQLTLFNNLIKEKYIITKDLDGLFRFITEKINAQRKIAVLASGDPGFYGILAALKRRLPGVDINVIPGISSVQLACAKLGITWDDAYLTSCHGRDVAPLIEAVKNHHKVVALTDPQHNPAALARTLLRAGTGNRTVFVGCNLSYPNETINATTLEELAQVQQWQAQNCVMVIKNE
ncbi:precorrin-6y C5,15-methyltransferase (decarboxylating) subunit CbiE [Desulfoscipio geothermicus]|uniref:Precorrin-6Y C5,15-methyltransferase (Decarboxylating) n=1 Tax=Desulfoscipio geothermicus DSM 3669 TaxID=1121426 RepID=A0A1I6DMB2_9FIRM|nr:precorrin-6y C5,15-methyltransferase (decarboxylating) subunit CbiE [Desulfoscipio geothermicus]SFR06564.1 precorrin-6Y C5,15-methyltransferase (decarboxylating) [Desulfoscipio geothermicus DSM 3669]